MHARLQVSVFSGYDLFYAGLGPDIHTQWHMDTSLYTTANQHYIMCSFIMILKQTGTEWRQPAALWEVAVVSFVNIAVWMHAR